MLVCHRASARYLRAAESAEKAYADLASAPSIIATEFARP